MSNNLSYTIPNDVLIHIFEFLNDISPFIFIFNYKKQKFEVIKNEEYIKNKLSLQKDGLYLEYIKNKNKTIELCKLAVKQNGLALKFVQNSLEFKLESVAF